MNKRWSIWIDIEGFSKLWSIGNVGLNGLNALMEGIWKIGTRHFSDSETRLFAHQFGDGFVIVSTFEEVSLDRCAAVAIALLRYVTKSECVARAAIAEGEFSDIQGCRPRTIRDAADLNDSGRIRLGQGIMTLLPVMGTALINSNKLDQKNPAKGSLLTIATCNVGRLSSGHRSMQIDGCPEISAVDWVHSSSDALVSLLAGVGAEFPTAEQSESRLLAYLERSTVSVDWKRDTLHYNQLVR